MFILRCFKSFWTTSLMHRSYRWRKRYLLEIPGIFRIESWFGVFPGVGKKLVDDGNWNQFYVRRCSGITPQWIAIGIPKWVMRFDLIFLYSNWPRLVWRSLKSWSSFAPNAGSWSSSLCLQCVLILQWQPSSMKLPLGQQFGCVFVGFVGGYEWWVSVGNLDAE